MFSSTATSARDHDRRPLTRRLTRAGGGPAPLLALLAGLLLAAAGPLRAAETGIQVSGVGEVQVVPDMARVALEVRREGADAAALKEELDKVTAEVLELGRSLDIAERDLTAAAVNIYPRYSRDPEQPTPDGVIASRTIEVILRDLEKVGDLINGALQAGANGVGGVQLDASNRAQLEQDALDRAIDDAVRKARQMAKRFEVELGPLQFASSSLDRPGPMMMEAMSMRGAAKDSFAPGEMTIEQRVQASFGIRP